jgi:hypothetical protein
VCDLLSVSGVPEDSSLLGCYIMLLGKQFRRLESLKDHIQSQAVEEE